MVSGDAFTQRTLTPNDAGLPLPILPGEVTLSIRVKDCIGRVLLSTKPTTITVHAHQHSLFILASDEETVSLALTANKTVEERISAVSLFPNRVTPNQPAQLHLLPPTAEFEVTTMDDGRSSSGCHHQLE